MNTISTAVDMVMRHIPLPILKQTFITLQQHRTRIPITLASCISEQIIYKKVLPDMNLVGGTTVLVPLDKCTVRATDPMFTVYHIPKSLTDNRRVVNVLELQFMGSRGTQADFATMTTSESGLAATQMLKSAKSLPYVSEGRVNLIADNTIMVEIPHHVAQNNAVRVMLEYDTALTNISARASLDFGKLVLLCTQAHIYNENIIPMNEGYIKGGANLSVYKDIIDGYSNALEDYYMELKTRWAKIAKLDDFETRKRIITLITGRLM